MAARNFQVVRDFAPGEALRGATVAIGNFDGVHRGHKAVITHEGARARQAFRCAHFRTASARVLQSR
jgi:riboflavin kinase / FMN adenylyltransferase